MESWRRQDVASEVLLAERADKSSICLATDPRHPTIIQKRVTESESSKNGRRNNLADDRRETLAVSQRGENKKRERLYVHTCTM